MRAKGFPHRELALSWEVLTHNLWMLARMTKKERFGSEEGDSEQASWHPEREAGSAGRISGCADATDRSSLWRRDAGAGLSDEARSCVGPWRRQWDRRQSRSRWAGLVRPAR